MPRRRSWPPTSAAICTTNPWRPALPRASYRLRKFVRKHRGAVAAWAALLLLLTAGLVVSATLYVRAERSRQDADRQRVAADVERQDADRQRVVADVEQSQEADRQRQAAQTERAAAETQRKAAETERDEARYQNYRSALLAADLSLQAGEIAQARQQLQAADPRLRGWEWRYLARLADSSVAATSVFSIQVREVRFSRNGDAVLARGYDVFAGPGRGVQGAAPARAPELSVTRVLRFRSVLCVTTQAGRARGRNQPGRHPCLLGEWNARRLSAGLPTPRR